MMLPILISVSLAPVSYLPCAKLAEDVAVASARAAAKVPHRQSKARIWFSLDLVECVSFGYWERLKALRSCWRHVPRLVLVGKRSRTRPHLGARCPRNAPGHHSTPVDGPQQQKAPCAGLAGGGI